MLKCKKSPLSVINNKLFELINENDWILAAGSETLNFACSCSVNNERICTVCFKS